MSKPLAIAGRVSTLRSAIGSSPLAGLRVHHAIHSLDRFVDLSSALKADRHRVYTPEIHGELQGGLAIFGIGEPAFPHQFHADYAHALLVHGLGVLNHFIYDAFHVAAGLDGVVDVHAGAIVVHADHGDVEPLIAGEFAQR